MVTKKKTAGKKPVTDLIEAPPSELEFRKPNQAIGLKIKKGKMTMLGRKLYNVFVYQAQRLKIGENAPNDSETNQHFYWVKLSDIAKDAAYDSKDTQVLKEACIELQNIRIESESETEWASEHLVASVKFVNPAGLKTRGGQLFVGFSFPPEVHAIVTKPSLYTKLSIYYQQILNSGHSIALYEICRRYATNPTKVTAIEDYEWWFARIQGLPVAEGNLPEYKYFKRDVLKPAIEEINACTDIVIDLREHKIGRKVARLQFEVNLKQQSDLEFPGPPIINGDLISRLEQFGFSDTEAANITVNHPEAKIIEAIESTNVRLHARNLPALNSAAAYFRICLKNAKGVPPKKGETPQLPGLGDDEPGSPPPDFSDFDAFKAARAKRAIELFNSLPKEEQRKVEDSFHETPSAKGVRMLKAPLKEGIFGRWYAQHLWGEATVEQMEAWLTAGGVFEA